MDYHREHNLKIKIVRIFNTYGPHMAFNDGRVVSNFINQAINGQNITIYGKGILKRPFWAVPNHRFPSTSSLTTLIGLPRP